MKVINSKDKTIILKAYIDDEIIVEETDRDDEILITIKYKYSKDEFILNLSSTTISCVKLVEYTPTIEVEADIDPTFKDKVLKINQYKIKYYLCPSRKILSVQLH